MTNPYPPQPPKRLVRSTSNRIIGGVCGGVADYLNMDVDPGPHPDGADLAVHRGTGDPLHHRVVRDTRGQHGADRAAAGHRGVDVLRSVLRPAVRHPAARVRARTRTAERGRERTAGAQPPRTPSGAARDRRGSSGSRRPQPPPRLPSRRPRPPRRPPSRSPRPSPRLRWSRRRRTRTAAPRAEGDRGPAEGLTLSLRPHRWSLWRPPVRTLRVRRRGPGPGSSGGSAGRR